MSFEIQAYLAIGIGCLVASAVIFVCVGWSKAKEIRAHRKGDLTPQEQRRLLDKVAQ